MSTPLRVPEPEPEGMLKVITSSPREIRIERVFEAPRDLVWRAHTEPDLLKQWWGQGSSVDIERMEVERGGHWRYVVRGPDGTDGFEGRYREVTPQERIVQTFEWDGMPGYVVLNALTFQDAGPGRTLAVVTSQFYTQEERDGMLQSGMEQGLSQSYEALDRVLAELG